jgi:hypothetical protein
MALRHSATRQNLVALGANSGQRSNLSLNGSVALTRFESYRDPSKTKRFNALGCQLIGQRPARLPKEDFGLHGAAVRAFELVDCKTAANWMRFDNSGL